MKAFLLDDPSTPVTIEQLASINVHYQYIDPANCEPELQAIMKERNYKNRDEVKLSESLPNLEEKLAIFFKEHLHEDEEIRYIYAGEGIFDVRSSEDQWYRLIVSAGDFVILPVGIYHRFTLTESRSVHAYRLFAEVPKWTPIYREE
eukprot:TRINITY_DN11599_c0_g1_i1.p1 TRINITY_DN11599_c0_g1~~TRINITY_DN11599_c0_g1_i1.p1  ORF type:complete len:147 (+),score=41.62 TRINITY_DN11599_c0_g1_i1:64-504(+)